MSSEAGDFYSAEKFFEAYTQPMDAESELSPGLFYAAKEGLQVYVFADTLAPEQGGMQAMIEGLLNRLLPEVGPADWIWVGSEAYFKPMPKGAKESDHRPGSLQAAAEAGDPEVIECIMICGVGPDSTVMATRPFKREDGEVIWLEDLKVMDGPEVGGGIPDLLRQAVR